MRSALLAYPPTRTGTFETPIDHFRFALPAKTFGLRYALYDKFASQRTAPILLYCGNEGALELFYAASGALFEHAKALRATVVFVEHRYYGKSMPFGKESYKVSLSNPTTGWGQVPVLKYH